MAGPFAERYRTIVEALFDCQLREADGIAETELDAILRRCGCEMPESLQDFYSVIGRFEPVTESHNRFYLPGSISEMDGKRVFCEENQAVVYWGYDEDQGWRTDPPVYQGVNNDGVEWYVEAGRCSDFLAGMIYWQALNGGLPQVSFRSDVDESVRQTAGSWPLVWQDENTQMFSRGAVVFSLTGQDGRVEVQAAGLSEATLVELWQSLGL